MRSASRSRRTLISMALILLFGTPAAYWIATRGTPAARRRGHAGRAAARAAARGRRDRPPRGVRPARASRRVDRGARDRHRVHEGGRRPRRHVRREPVLRPNGSRRVRVDRSDAAGGRADAGGRAGARVPAGRPSARGRGPRRRRGARLRPRHRRVRRDDHVRGLAPGDTQTLSLAIYEQFDVDFDVALAISAVLVVISAAVLLSVKLLTRWRSGSTTPIPFAPSTRASS